MNEGLGKIKESTSKSLEDVFQNVSLADNSPKVSSKRHQKESNQPNNNDTSNKINNEKNAHHEILDPFEELLGDSSVGIIAELPQNIFLSDLQSVMSSNSNSKNNSTNNSALEMPDGEISSANTSQKNVQEVVRKQSMATHNVNFSAHNGIPTASSFKRRSTIDNHSSLISFTRPRTLPPKDPKEDRKHLQEYEEMMRRAQKKETDKCQQETKRREDREHFNQKALKFWENEIIPHWNDATMKDKRSIQLWSMGLPSKVRGRLWSKYLSKEFVVPLEMYKILCQKASAISDDPAIHKDIEEAFSDLSIFRQNGPLCQSLNQVLNSYFQVFRSDTPYVQGTSVVAGLVLLNLDEADAFSVFAAILNRPLPKSFVSPKHETVKILYCTIHDKFLKKFDNELFCHMSRLQVNASLYLTKWVLTLFCQILPLEVSSRLMDNYILFGDLFLMRTSIALILALRDRLLAAETADAITMVLNSGGKHISEDLIFAKIDHTFISESLWNDLLASGHSVLSTVTETEIK